MSAQDLMLKEKKPNKEEKANILSRLTFWWCNSLVWLASKKVLDSFDVWTLGENDKAHTIHTKFTKHWQAELKKPQPSFVKALAKTIGFNFCMSLLFYSIYAGSQLTSPQILKLIVTWFTNRLYHIPQNENMGYYYALAIFLVAMTGSLCYFQAQYFSAKVGCHLRAIVILAVYRKSIVLSNKSRAETSQGVIMNLMSNDSQRLLETLLILNNGLFAPFQLIVALALLWQSLGVYTLVGLGVVVVTFPINGVFGKLLTKLRSEMVTYTDRRVKVTNEILQAIKVIKMYGWESSFSQRLTALRTDELVHLSRFSYIRAFMVFFFIITPSIMILLMFVAYTQTDHILNPADVFNVISLVNVMRIPLAFAPLVIAFIAMVLVTLRRLGNFMLMGENLVSISDFENSNKPPFIKVIDADFTWGYVKEDQRLEKMGLTNKKGGKGKKPKKPRSRRRTRKQKKIDIKQKGKEEEAANTNVQTEPSQDQNQIQKVIPSLDVNITVDKNQPPPLALHGIDFEVNSGNLMLVIGPVGSGKTSLCMAILSEIERVRGEVILHGKVAYSAQKEWILNATLRDNILFGKEYNEQKYQKVLDACALRKDLEMFPQGDLVEIGERGVNLSGGQKQRVSIARAVYSDSDVYIFDDPLSAVDAHVGKHLFQEVFQGMLKGKLVFLTTNQLQYLPFADQIMLLKDGRILEKGTYHSLVESGLDFATLMANFGISEDQKNSSSSEEENDEIEIVTGANEKPINKSSEINKSSDKVLSKSKEIEKTNLDKLHKKGDGTLIEKEERESGEVTLRIYFIYFFSGGVLVFLSVMLSAVFEAGTSTGSNWWLSYWTSHEIGPNAHSTVWYLGLYIGWTGVSSLFSLMRGLVSVIFFISNSKNLHSKLLNTILRAPMSFFDTTPLGRIINRFTRDMDTIDNLLPQSFGQMLGSSMSVLAVIIVICCIVPWLLVAFGPIIVFYYFLQKFYRNTSRELQRMESIARSPIFAHFSETLNGVSSIRAYRCTDRFIKENEERLNENMKFFLTLQATNQWLGLRLDVLGNIIVFLTAIILIVTPAGNNPSLVGLALSYGLFLTVNLNRATLLNADVETKMNAVERITTYIEIPPEAPPIADVRPPENWPTEGKIEFTDFVMSYRPGLDPVLKGVTCKFKPHEKVGIVGRTGAGKSSLLLALFRLVEKTSGTITIDGIDTSTLGLQDLRKKLAIIPQDPVLFSGTIRGNLDPFLESTDEEVWIVLEQIQLKAAVENLGGLTAIVSESGDNWSVGQKQLICLGRALLKKPKILVLDEATASVDVVSDLLIQRTLREKFADATILTIAHRLNTIMDSDRIMVMSDGRVEELDTPVNLLNNPDGFLTWLVDETGPSNAAFLRAIAQGKMSVLDAANQVHSQEESGEE